MSNTTPKTVNRARVKRPERDQVEWRPLALDQVLPSDHRARSVWRYVDALDLSGLYAKIQAVEGKAGRDAVDPKILLALWMFATIEAVSNARRQAARERAVSEREQRVEQALAELTKLQEQKEKRRKGSSAKARSSTTDPEARMMKTGDGGFRPAYNVQFATDGQTRVIAGGDVTNSGSDRGHSRPRLGEGESSGAVARADVQLHADARSGLHPITTNHRLRGQFNPPRHTQGNPTNTPTADIDAAHRGSTKKPNPKNRQAAPAK